MRLKEALEKVEHYSQSGLKKRFACSHCGKTWVEIVGVFVGKIEGEDDFSLRAGTESEVCQTCRFRTRSCPECGSKDAYEINFSSAETKDAPFSFSGIRVVSNT
jgi:hypothetical protein